MSDVLNIGTSALQAYQRLIATAGHNIANMATEGYNKQTTELLAGKPTIAGDTLIGSGAKIGVTRRAVDELLNDTHRDNISSEESFITKKDFADRVNTLLANAQTGISQSMTDFFTSLQSLTSVGDPSATTSRQVFFDKAASLVQRFNVLSERMTEQSQDISGQVKNAVQLINQYSESLSKVNSDIASTASLGRFTVPNDLLDERDRLLNELSKMVDINVVVQDQGLVDVFIGTGQSLVVGTVRTQLDTAINESDPNKVDVRIVSSSVNQVITDTLSGGKIGALNEVQKEFIDPAVAALGRMALTFALTVNDQHKKGIDLNGELGVNFFKDVNDISQQLSRSFANSKNLGDAIFRVQIDNVTKPDPGPHTVYGQSGNLVNAGSVGTVAVNDLTINGIVIPAALADGVSTSDATASAIALANTINTQSSSTGVSAKAQINSLYLGTFTPGAYIAGEFQINGINVITNGANEGTILRDINALSTTTGVRAVGDGSLNITLIAEDGRNIQVTSNTNTPVATFQHFDTNSGVALDQVQRAGITLTNSSSSPITIGGNQPGDAGLIAGTTPATQGFLTESEYRLNYDGTNYILTRLSDSKIVYRNTSSTIQADGITINLSSGTMNTLDEFIIKPTFNAATAIRLNISETNKLAFASPIRVLGTDDPSNDGTGQIKLVEVLNTSGSPTATGSVPGNAFSVAKKLTPPIRVEFFNDSNGDPTRYRVYDTSGGLPGVQIGPEQSFIPNQDNEIFPITSVVNSNAPGPNMPGIYDPGYRVTISGAPKAGDVFTIDYNTDARTDNRNALNILALQEERFFNGGVDTYQGAYSSLVNLIGSQTKGADINLEAARSLRRQSHEQILSKGGVNLDEEAANLIRFQQGFRAAAQLLSIGGSLFQDVLSALR